MMLKNELDIKIKLDFKRSVLIGIQIGSVLRDLTDESDEYINKLINYIEKGYIQSFTFYGMRDDVAYAVYSIDVDWDKYQNFINVSDNVSISNKYTNGKLALTIQGPQRFLQYIESNDFTVKWVMRFSNNLTENLKNKLRTELGLCQLKEPITISESITHEQQMIYEDLPELSVTIKL